MFIMYRNVKNILLNCRQLHITSVCYGQTRIMKKIISTNTKKKKHRYTDAPIAPSPKTFTEGAFEGKKSVNSKRVAVLNKLFMRHITDLMATGESASVFIGHGLEINRVQVTPDFQLVKVFWLAKGTENDNLLEKLLQKHAGYLRYELSQLRVMGIVPKIEFMKDKKFAQLLEIDLRLTKADFGEDYEPPESFLKLKSQLELQTRLDPHIREKIKLLDQELNEDVDDSLPPMPQNVLGLNHGEIMERVRKSMKKSMATHRLTSEDVENRVPHSVNTNPVSFPSMKAQREAFREFFAKRELLRSKANKEIKNDKPELDYLEEEWETKNKLNDKSFNFEEYLDDTDYIEEDDSSNYK